MESSGGGRLVEEECSLRVGGGRGQVEDHLVSVPRYVLAELHTAQRPNIPGVCR